MSYKLLSDSVIKYIRNEGWENLTQIQAAAISRIILTDKNYILASRTASGKTEAAFLPVLSKTNFNEYGVQVLCISPLKALINDQFIRIQELCDFIDIRVTKWHGEANKSSKNKLVKKPEGVVLITPESIEAMLVNSPYNVVNLFGNLAFIIIDEIHSFLGNERGVHLMSLISRLELINKKRIRTIGLSATIGKYNYVEAKKLTGNPNNTTVLLDKMQKETSAEFKSYEITSSELSLDILKDIFKESIYEKVLIFPNTRARAEEIAVKLKRIAKKTNNHANFFSHHSSVDKEIREHIEYFAKNSRTENFGIACTSTLELGIDIGTVDKIIQIDSTHSVSSLVQRVGRSGRTKGKVSRIVLYSTNTWSLLQSISCWTLYESGFLEPLEVFKKPYDILFHQLLSTLKQTSGCSRSRLVNVLKNNFAFQEITESEISEIIDFSIAKQYLEYIDREIIIGIEGEQIVNNKEFYSVFSTSKDFKVMHAGRKIGEMPLSPQVRVDENIFLAAQIWKIQDIDFSSHKIYVEPAKDGKNPKFYGDVGFVHHEVRKEMLRILKGEDFIAGMDEKSRNNLEELRKDFKEFNVTDFDTDRPVVFKEKEIILYSFASTKINNTLHFLLSSIGYQFDFEEKTSKFIFEDIVIEKLIEGISNLTSEFSNIDFYLDEALNTDESYLDFTKWGKYLPNKFKREIIKERYFNISDTQKFITNLKLVVLK